MENMKFNADVLEVVIMANNKKDLYHSLFFDGKMNRPELLCLFFDWGREFAERHANTDWTKTRRIYSNAVEKFVKEKYASAIDELDWKKIREEISHRLIDTSEDNPIVFKGEHMPIVGETWPDTHGLSSNDLPRVEKIYQVPGDGTIWVHLYGEYDKETGDPAYHDIEEPGLFNTDDISNISSGLTWPNWSWK